ncbi:MAG TPA: hypothetical protein VGV90_13300 [Solirubrobacteraceae bacterium]|nr:hypothetical protein [Solirubrobacteraceae bacterium]
MRTDAIAIRRAAIATFCCCLAMLALAPAVHAADPFFGLFSSDMSDPPAELGSDMSAHAATGVGVVREHLFWDRIERAPGVFDFSQSDALIAAATQRGMTVLPVLVGTPQFYSTRPTGVTTDGWAPRDPAAIARFATQLTRRYGARGTYWGCLLPGLLCRRPYRPIMAWQVWNEPDRSAWWRTGPDPNAYTALLAHAYSGLKAGDAAAEVVLGGITIHNLGPGQYLDQLYDRGAARYFDTLAVHPYSGTVGGVVNEIRRARAIAVAKGDGSVPIRATEYGFATGGVREWVADPTCQAALLAATTRELSARRTELGLRSIVQFQWQDRPTESDTGWADHAGLLFMDGRPKPALAAFTDAVAGRPPAGGRTVSAVCGPQYQG